MQYVVAELRGSSIRERTRKLIGIAHPRFRDELERKASQHGAPASPGASQHASALIKASLSAFQPVVSEAQPLGFLPGSIIRESLRVLARIQNREGGGVRDG